MPTPLGVAAPSARGSGLGKDGKLIIAYLAVGCYGTAVILCQFARRGVRAAMAQGDGDKHNNAFRPAWMVAVIGHTGSVGDSTES